MSQKKQMQQIQPYEHNFLNICYDCNQKLNTLMAQYTQEYSLESI